MSLINYIAGFNDNYSLDINNDGIPDFTFNAYEGGGMIQTAGGCSIESLGSNSICVVDKGRVDPDTMKFASMINKDLYWNNGTLYFNEYVNSQVPNSSSSSGIWLNLGDKYVGLRVIESTDTIYGWVRVHVNSPDIIIKDYASYLRPASINIRTFDGKSGVNIYPNPATNKVYIERTNNEAMKVSLFDMLGRQVNATINSENKKTEIDVSGLNEGIYFVKVQTSKGIINKEILIEK